MLGRWANCILSGCQFPIGHVPKIMKIGYSSRQSYCKTNQAYFFGPPRIKTSYRQNQLLVTWLSFPINTCLITLMSGQQKRSVFCYLSVLCYLRDLLTKLTLISRSPYVAISVFYKSTLCWNLVAQLSNCSYLCLFLHFVVVCRGMVTLSLCLTCYITLCIFYVA